MLYKTHKVFHGDGDDDHKRGDDEAVDHGRNAGFPHILKACVQTDRGKRGHHEKLAHILHAGGDPGGNDAETVDRR